MKIRQRQQIRRRRRLYRTSVSDSRRLSSRSRGKVGSGDFLLTTSRYDLLHDWNKISDTLDTYDPERLDDDFCIYLEDWPQLVHRFTSKDILLSVRPSKFLSYDVLHCVTYTHTVIKHSFKDNARELDTERTLFPCILLGLCYIPEKRIYVGLDQSGNILMMVYDKHKDKVLVAAHLDQVYNFTCLTYIKHTRHVVVGGGGFLNSYQIIGGKEASTTFDSGKPMNPSLGSQEFVRQLSVDAVNHLLHVVTDTCLIIMDYMTMTEVRRLRETEVFGHITCCCVYRKNEYLITGNSLGLIKIWNPCIFQEVHTYKGHSDKITGVTTSWTKALLLSCSADGWVFIWRLDVFRNPMQKTKVGDTVIQLGLTTSLQNSAVGFWAFTDDGVVVYEYNMFSNHFAYMESTVYKLERHLGHDNHPNRILVATEDGGLRHLNPVTGNMIGYMFPMTSLYLVQQFAYNSMRQRSYLVMREGSVLVLNCAKSPFRGLEMLQPTSADDAVSCITGGLLSIGNGLEDPIIFAGYKNGQIQMIASELFVMARPIQAHHSPVECLDLVASVSPSGNQVFRSSKYAVSASADHAIKVWKIVCKPCSKVGLDICLQLLIHIRCPICPRMLTVTEDRLAVVYHKQNTLDMFDISKKESTVNKPPLLTHTPDYDHTDTVTSLEKCPLIRIFATSSLDCTIKIWDDQNELLRELIFHTAIVDCCFASDIGHLLSASGKILQLTSPDKYLPWYYLETMRGKTYQQTDEQREGQKEYNVTIKSWIEPSRIAKKMLPNREERQAGKLQRRAVGAEDWEVAWIGPTGRRAINIPIPSLFLCRMQEMKHRAEEEEHHPEKQLSMVFPFQGSTANLLQGTDQERSRLPVTPRSRQGSLLVPSSSLRPEAISSRIALARSREEASSALNVSDAEELGAGAPTPIQFLLKRTKGDRDKDRYKERVIDSGMLREMGEDLPAFRLPCISSQEELDSVRRFDWASSSDSESESSVEGISEEARRMLEGLGAVREWPKAFNILMQKEHFTPMEHGILDVAKKPSSSVSVTPLRLPTKEGTAHKEGLRDYKTRKCISLDSQELSENRSSALEVAIRELETREETKYKRFMKKFGHNMYRTMSMEEGASPDEVADKSPRQTPTICEPTEFEAASTSTDELNQSVVGALQKKVEGSLTAPPGSAEAYWLKLATAHNAMQGLRSPVPNRITKEQAKKRSRQFDIDLTWGRKSRHVSKSERKQIKRNLQLVALFKGPEKELEEGLKKVRNQPWFPPKVPLDHDATVTAWTSLLAPETDASLLRNIIYHTLTAISNNEVSGQLKDTLVASMKELLSTMPLYLAIAVLHELAVDFDPNILHTIGDDFFTHSNDKIRVQMRTLNRISRVHKASRERESMVQAERRDRLSSTDTTTATPRHSFLGTTTPGRYSPRHSSMRPTSVGECQQEPQIAEEPKPQQMESLTHAPPLALKTIKYGRRESYMVYDGVSPTPPRGFASVSLTLPTPTPPTGFAGKSPTPTRVYAGVLPGVPPTCPFDLEVGTEFQEEQDGKSIETATIASDVLKDAVESSDVLQQGKRGKAKISKGFVARHARAMLSGQSSTEEPRDLEIKSRAKVSIQTGARSLKLELPSKKFSRRKRHSSGLSGKKFYKSHQKFTTLLKAVIRPRIELRLQPKLVQAEEGKETKGDQEPDEGEKLQTIFKRRESRARKHSKGKNMPLYPDFKNEALKENISEMIMTESSIVDTPTDFHGVLGMALPVIDRREAAEKQATVLIMQKKKALDYQRCKVKQIEEETRQTFEDAIKERKSQRDLQIKELRMKAEQGIYKHDARTSPPSSLPHLERAFDKVRIVELSPLHEKTEEVKTIDKQSSIAAVYKISSDIIESVTTEKLEKPVPEKKTEASSESFEGSSTTRLSPRFWQAKLPVLPPVVPETTAEKTVLQGAPSILTPTPPPSPAHPSVGTETTVEKIAAQMPYTDDGPFPPSTPILLLVSVDKVNLNMESVAGPVKEDGLPKQDKLEIEDSIKSEKMRRLRLLSEKYDPAKQKENKAHVTQKPALENAQNVTVSTDKSISDYMRLQHRSLLKKTKKAAKDKQPCKAYVPTALWRSGSLATYRQLTCSEEVPQPQVIGSVSGTQPQLQAEVQAKAVQQKSSENLEADRKRTRFLISSEDTKVTGGPTKRSARKTDSLELSMQELQRVWSHTHWVRGELGLRVARGVTFRARAASEGSKPCGAITALRGRLGMDTLEQVSGQSSYGRMEVQWTTKVPHVASGELGQRVRQLELKGPHHRQALSRVDPSMARIPDNIKAVPSSEPIEQNKEKIEKVPKVVPVYYKKKEAENLEELYPEVLYSSFSLLPSSVRDHIIKRLRSTRL